jgi:uncharacterized membrane protein YuzA (DUF378 family)
LVFRSIIVGGINWLLPGACNFNLGRAIFRGDVAPPSRAVP